MKSHVTSEETRWEVEMEPGHEGSTEVSFLQVRSEDQQPGQHQSWPVMPRHHPGLLNLNPNLNKAPGDADEVSKHSISLAFLLQAVGATDGGRVRGWE